MRNNRASFLDVLRLIDSLILETSFYFILDQKNPNFFPHLCAFEYRKLFNAPTFICM